MVQSHSPPLLLIESSAFWMSCLRMVQKKREESAASSCAAVGSARHTRKEMARRKLPGRRGSSIERIGAAGAGVDLQTGRSAFRVR